CLHDSGRGAFARSVVRQRHVGAKRIRRTRGFRGRAMALAPTVLAGGADPRLSPLGNEGSDGRRSGPLLTIFTPGATGTAPPRFAAWSPWQRALRLRPPSPPHPAPLHRPPH